MSGPPKSADAETVRMAKVEKPTVAAPAVDVSGVGEEPVFVDGSGRRRRTLRRIGWALGLACAGYAVVLVFSLAGGNSNAPWLPLTGPQEGESADGVRTDAEPEKSPEETTSGPPEPPAGPDTPIPAAE
ncbi:translation initiation factor IF-2, partial [Streptomyces sp. OF3]|nr:translation initiation factor IF-2 [Streptomyces alkaliterrae]